MKKSLKKQERKEKQRRLTLNRETLQDLDEPAALEQALGGAMTCATGSQVPTVGES